LPLQQQLFFPRDRYKKGTIAWPTVQQSCVPTRQAVVAMAQRVIELGR